MTLAALQSLVGAPATPGETYSSLRRGVLITAWSDALGGPGGWWYALTRDGQLLAIGWTSGDRRDRDLLIARAMVEHAPITVEGDN